MYLDPKSMYNDGPKPLKIAEQAISIHTLGVEVVSFWVAVYHNL